MAGVAWPLDEAPFLDALLVERKTAKFDDDRLMRLLGSR
jgi:hypothetical protein